MVTISEIQVTTIHIQLSPDEAHWLKCVMQNPLNGKHPIDEAPQDKVFRKSFWDALGGDDVQPKLPLVMETPPYDSGPASPL